jgi:hypothetical protein
VPPKGDELKCLLGLAGGLDQWPKLMKQGAIKILRLLEQAGKYAGSFICIISTIKACFSVSGNFRNSQIPICHYRE